MMSRNHHLALPQDRHSSETWKISRVKRRCCGCVSCTPSFAFFTQAFPGPRTKPQEGFGFSPVSVRRAQGTQPANAMDQDKINPESRPNPEAAVTALRLCGAFAEAGDRLAFSYIASDSIVPRSNHVGLWVSAASGFSLLRPKSSRLVRKAREVSHAEPQRKQRTQRPRHYGTSSRSPLTSSLIFLLRLSSAAVRPLREGGGAKRRGESVRGSSSRRRVESSKPVS